MAELTQARIERKIAAARLALFWESLWNALCWPLILTLVLAATALSGLLTQLPDLLRFGLLGLLAVAIVWSLRHVLRITWPTPYAAMRRIEAHSETTAMIGDRMDTDMRSGLEAGLQTHLVLSGSTALEDVSTYPFRPVAIHEGIGGVVPLVS